MLTPPGTGARRAGRARSAGGRLLAVLVVLGVVCGGIYALWRFGFGGSSTDGVSASATPSATRSATSTPTGKPSACATAVPTGVATIKPPAPSKVRVNVYNATKRSGLAVTVAASLRTRGFVVGTVSNDPLGKTVAGTAEIRSGVASPAAITVWLHVPGAVRVADTRRDGSVDLVLGNSWTALRTPAQAAAAAAALATPRPAC